MKIKIQKHILTVSECFPNIQKINRKICTTRKIDSEKFDDPNIDYSQVIVYSVPVDMFSL